jgi:choline dehydrogenase
MSYDTVIVGAGTAGAVLAARLSQDTNRTVLLLEAGPDFPRQQDLPDEIRRAYGYAGIWGQAFGFDTRFGWNYRARSTDTHPDMFVPRGRIVGGSSAVNAQIFLRGLPEDYDSWAAAGNDEWSFDCLLPTFRRIEADRDFVDESHGIDGPIPVRRFSFDECQPEHQAFHLALRDRGVADCPDHNDPASTGVGPLPLNNADGLRWSAAMGYLTPEVRARTNLEIRPDSHVRRVVVERGRAVAVELEQGTGSGRIDGGEIVLCAGAIGTPHLLMTSGIGIHCKLSACLSSPTCRAWVRTCVATPNAASRCERGRRFVQRGRSRRSRWVVATPPPDPVCATTCSSTPAPVLRLAATTKPPITTSLASF